MRVGEVSFGKHFDCAQNCARFHLILSRFTHKAASLKRKSNRKCLEFVNEVFSTEMKYLMLVELYAILLVICNMVYWNSLNTIKDISHIANEVNRNVNQISFDFHKIIILPICVSLFELHNYQNRQLYYCKCLPDIIIMLWISVLYVLCISMLFMTRVSNFLVAMKVHLC